DLNRTLSNPIIVNGTTTVTGNLDLILNGGVSGTGDLTKTGTGALSLAAGSSIGGAWTLAGGALASLNLQIAAHRSLTMNTGTFVGSLNNSGTFTYNNGSFNGSLINHGAVVINNTFLSVAQGITNFA